MYKEARVAFALDKRAGDETSDVYNHVAAYKWWLGNVEHPQKREEQEEHSEAESLFTNDSAAAYTP
jgi:hypothetical protein